MKNKLLSLLLVITLLIVTISVGLPASLAADGDNLITNGDFAEYSGYTPTGWKLALKKLGGASAQIVEDTQLPNGETVNALKVTTTKKNTGVNQITHSNTIKIEKNASYTMTYWVKVSAIAGLKTYMYEPDYIAKDGSSQHNDHASEGTNIYSYTYDSGSTRVIRTDVQHKWVIAETGTAIDAVGPSMFISRVDDEAQVLTPDYPATNREGEWLQVIHTFATGNNVEHEAEVTYEITFPSVKDGEVWLADFNMSVKKASIETYYTPDVNDVTLGLVSKDIPLVNGSPVELMAEPFGDNIFEGWFVDGELVSTNANMTFTYDSANPPKYEARFKKGTFGITDGGFETYTNGQKLSEVAYVTQGTWTETLFKNSSLDGDNLYFSDSRYNGNYRRFVVTNEQAHTGDFSAKYEVPFGYFGRKFTGLNKNTKYTVSFYAMSKNSTSDSAGVNAIVVTDANVSAICKNTAGTGLTDRTVEAGSLFKTQISDNAKDVWTKYEVTFDTKDSTEVIVWAHSNGNDSVLYVDNYSIKCPPQEFKPAVSDPNLGFVTPNGLTCSLGDEVTVVANPANDSKFVGWYIGDDLQSEDAEYTFIFSEESKNLVAKFEPGVNTLPDYSFENSYTNNQLLAESPDINYEKDTSLWNDELYKTSSKDGNNTFFIDSEWSKWGKVIATTEQAHTGSFSIKMSPNSRSMGYKLTGLTKNTKYTISFYAYTTGTTGSNANTISDIAVTDANVSCIMKNADNKLVQRTDETGALARTSGSTIDCRESWKKFSVRFNSADSTDVILWIRPESEGTKLYVDDVSLGFTPKEFKPLSNNSGLGTVSPENYVECSEGQEITVTASPYEDVTFTGWYVDDELISEEATFTFEYDDKYQGLTAVFAGIPGTIPNGSFEYYHNGQVLASYSNTSNPKFNNNPPWSVDTTYRNDGSLSLTVTNERAHSGEKSAVLNIPYRYAGLDIEGLQPGTKYMLSFWAYITGKEPTKPDDDKNPKNVSTAFIIKKDHDMVVENGAGKFIIIPNNYRLGSLDSQVDCYNKWSKIDVMFTTPEDTGDVKLVISFSGLSAKLYIDDFTIGTGIKGNISAELGGAVTSSFNSQYVLKGTEVTAEAIPYEGNTFVGWYNERDEKVSDLAKYTFTAEEDFSLIAKFDGYNKPAVDLFSIGGKDGTFENGAIGSWRFNDSQYSSEWCSASVGSRYVYEGSRSLEINGRYRNSVLPLTGLTPNSDYRLSFYLNIPDTNEKAKLDSLGIVGSDFDSLGDANLIFAQIKSVKGNTGWNKVDLYFNTGSNTSANLVFRYSAETLSNGLDRLYMDNVSLHAYIAEKEIVNGGFDDNKTYWIGNGSIVTEDGNKALSLAADETVYQCMKVEAFTYYTVSFKAKGKLTAAALDLSKFNITNKNLLNSKSYLDVDGTEWTKYTYNVYSGIHQAMNFAFAADANGAMIDDISVVKNIENANAILEHYDFETDRFDLTALSANSPFSIYTATDENDPNVYSGSKALKFTYDPALAETASILDEAWLSYQTGIGNNFKISLKYKIVNGQSGGSVNLAPEYSGTYGSDTGLEHLALNSDWNTVTFFVNNMNFGVLKFKIAATLGVTSSDFYVDDIVISVAPPMVIEENSKTTYCERLYNAIDNEGFESPASDNDWKDLPATAKIVKGDALKGSHFLRANAGTKYVVQFTVNPNTEYYFAASVRGTAKTVGSIGITIDLQGKTYYANRDEEPASKVEFDPKETNWKRKGFKFVTTGSDKANICIEVTEGYLDIDSVMLFTSDYAYRYDPNDYTVYVPYDYDNLKSETTVLYGGFGKQPYYTGKIDSDENGLIDGDLDGDGIADDIVLDEEDTNTDDGTDSNNDTTDNGIDDGINNGFDTNENNGASDDSYVEDYTDESPSTGDKAMPVMIIIIAVIASALLMFATKRKEGAENA